jgi:hypothetical protein
VGGQCLVALPAAQLTQPHLMLPDDIGKVDEALLRSVCTGRWPESQTLEFKRELPETSDKLR